MPNFEDPHSATPRATRAWHLRVYEPIDVNREKPSGTVNLQFGTIWIPGEGNCWRPGTKRVWPGRDDKNTRRLERADDSWPCDRRAILAARRSRGGRGRQPRFRSRVIWFAMGACWPPTKTGVPVSTATWTITLFCSTPRSNCCRHGGMLTTSTFAIWLADQLLDKFQDKTQRRFLFHRIGS